jgi:uncharacterized protein YdbL (DUF1318 family)
MQKIKNTSIAMDQDTKELLRISAIKKNTTSSGIVRELIKNYIDLLVNDSNETSVILKIPAEKRNDPKALREWLQIKVDAIAKALDPKAT